MAREFLPEVILMDINLPGISGIEVMKILRAELEANIKARRPFLDFPFSRIRPDGSQQYFRASGEPMFDRSARFVGYRDIGVEVTGRLFPEVPAGTA